MDGAGRVLCYVCGQRVLTPASLAPHLKRCERAALRAPPRRVHATPGGRPWPPASCTRPLHIQTWNVAEQAFEASLPGYSTAIEGLRASRARRPRQALVGVTDRGLKFGEAEDKQAAAMHQGPVVGRGRAD